VAAPPHTGVSTHATPSVWLRTQEFLSVALRNVAGTTARPSAGLGEQGMVRAHEHDATRQLGRPSGGRRPWWVARPVVRRPVPGVDWESSGTRAVVRVTGELGASLESFLADRPLAGCRELEIDLAGVPSMGSGGASTLLAVRRWCLQRGIALRLRDVQPSVWRVVELAGLGAAFDASFEPGPDPVQELALF
jgi:anti-anti-sigma factor